MNRLRARGVVTTVSRTPDHLEQFMEIYWQTMRRVQADEGYFFDRTYFQRLMKALGESACLVIAQLDGQPVAGALCVECQGILQFHLGGTHDDFLALSPMKLVVDAVRRLGNERGLRVFHLGGGVGGQRDSLLHFKAGFSDRRHEFFTWRWVLRPDIYAELCAARTRQSDGQGIDLASTDYFPAYRAPLRPAADQPVPARGDTES